MIDFPKRNDFEGAIEYASQMLKAGKLTADHVQSIAMSFDDSDEADRVVKTISSMARAAKK